MTDITEKPIDPDVEAPVREAVEQPFPEPLPAAEIVPPPETTDEPRSDGARAAEDTADGAEAKPFPDELARAFLDARTPHAWTEEPVAEETLRQLYDLVKLGPTSANCSPARFVFIRSRESKDRLRPALTRGNVEPVMSAPVTVIVAYDPSFYDYLPRLYPQADARSWFAWNDDFSQETAMRNSSLQAGYLIIAARLLGLDCWPMSGFDNARIDQLFLDGRGWRSNLLVSLGHAAPAAAPRNPRLGFDESCEVI